MFTRYQIQEQIDFLSETLIPDLLGEGEDMNWVKDFQTCVAMLLQQQKTLADIRKAIDLAEGCNRSDADTVSTIECALELAEAIAALCEDDAAKPYHPVTPEQKEALTVRLRGFNTAQEDN